MESNRVDYRLIGENLKRKRLGCGYTQAEVAEKIFVSVSHYNRIENGRKGITLETLSLLAGVFECDIKDFLYDKMGMPVHTIYSLLNEYEKTVVDRSGIAIAEILLSEREHKI